MKPLFLSYHNSLSTENTKDKTEVKKYKTQAIRVLSIFLFMWFFSEQNINSAPEFLD